MHYALRWLAIVAALAAAFITGIHLERHDAGRAEPWRWKGGAGPETECWYEYLPNGRVSARSGEVGIEEWTVCEPITEER